MTLSTLQDQTLFQPVVFDARGNGDGITVPTITGDHESRVTDYTAIAVDLYNGAVTGDKAAPITCRSIGSHSGPQVAEQRTFSEQAYDSFKQSGSGGTLKGSGGAVGYGGGVSGGRKDGSLDCPTLDTDRVRAPAKAFPMAGRTSGNGQTPKGESINRRTPRAIRRWEIPLLCRNGSGSSRKCGHT